MDTHAEKEKFNELVPHYLAFRQLLGFLGMFLPVILIIGSFLDGCGHLENSISNYYYTALRDFFVVILSAVALFLITYKGYDTTDKWVTSMAGILGLLTAFIPTNYKSGICLPCYNQLESTLINQPNQIIPCPHSTYIGYIHLGCAAAFFLTLAGISIFLFTKKSETDKPTNEKLKRNRIYRICGGIMVFCVLVLVPCFISHSLRDQYDKINLVFWMESVALEAFGFSWIVKGEFLLKDKPV